MKNLYHYKIFMLLLLAAIISYKAEALPISVVSSSGPITNADYSTLKQAFDKIDSGQHTGAISIVVTASTIEYAPAVLVASGTQTGTYTANYSSISIIPSGGPWTISGTGANFNSKGLVILDGADNVKIDGGANRNLIFINNGTTKPAAIWLKSGNVALQGCTNDTIRNCQFSTGLLSAESYGIIASGYNVTTPVPTYTLAAYDCDNVLIENNKVYNCQYGITAAGNSVALSDNFIIRKNEIGADNLYASINKYGVYISNMDSIVIDNNNIYNVMSSVDAYGIYLINTKSFKVKNNIIANIASNSTYSTSIYGIYNSTSANTASIKGTIESNKISDVQYLGATAVNVGAYGIYSTKSPNLDLRNNVISGVLGSGYGAASALTSPTFGICLDDATSLNVNVFYNSVNLYGLYSQASVGANKTMSACLGLLNASITGAFNNNILSDSIISPSASIAGSIKAYAVYAAASFGFNASTKYLNYNDYYVNGTGANIGMIGVTEYATYTAWKATGAVPTDANSKSIFPKFNSPSNLTLLPGSNLANSALVLSSVPSDLLGAIRSATPSLGAYEVLSDVINPNISFTKLANTISLSSRTLSAVLSDNYSGIDTTSNKARIYYKKPSAPNDLSGWNFSTVTGYSSAATFLIDYLKINAGAFGDTIQYFVVAQDLNSPANITMSSGTPSSPLSSVALSASAFPITGNIDSYKLVDGISGVQTVGLNGNYPNLTGVNGAFNALNNKVILGDVTLKIISDITETGDIALQNPSFQNGNEKIYITPDAATLRTLSGTKDSIGLFRFINAKNVIIDGSFNNSGKYLKFVGNATTSTTIAGATIQLANTAGAGAVGCKNITIKNSIVVGPVYNTGITSKQRFAIYAGDLQLNIGSSCSNG